MNSERPMDISFVILTWNSERHIAKCLESLFGQLRNDSFSFEVFLVDNGSSDRTVTTIESYENDYAKHIIPIYFRTNRGTTYSRNIALRRAIGKYVIIMDSDVQLVDGVIQGAISTLQDLPRVGLVAPKLLYPDGRLQKSTDIFPTLQHKMLRYLFLKYLERSEGASKKLSTLHDVDYAISAMWVMRKSVIDEIGLLDENIFYSPEDVDYCLRLWKAGYRVVYDPTISAFHDAQEISRKFKLSSATISHISGLVYYFRKHQYFFRRPNFRKPKAVSILQGCKDL